MVESFFLALTAWLGAAGKAEFAEAIFVLMSIIGQHFVAKRQVKGFYFWVCGNVVALVLFAYLSRWMTLALYAYFLWKSIEGIYVWRELDRQAAVSTTFAIAMAHKP